MDDEKICELCDEPYEGNRSILVGDENRDHMRSRFVCDTCYSHIDPKEWSHIYTPSELRGRTIMNKEQRDALFGEEPKFSEHKAGEVIKFLKDGEEKEGRILHVIPPGATHQGGQPHGILYAVVTQAKGFPAIVSPSDVVE